MKIINIISRHPFYASLSYFISAFRFVEITFMKLGITLKNDSSELHHRRRYELGQGFT